MGRGSRGRGRGSMGEHPEDEEDLYEEEIEVRFSIALGASSVIGRFSGLQVLWVGLLRLRPEDVGGVPKGRKTWSVRHTFKRFLLVLGSGGVRL